MILTETREEVSPEVIRQLCGCRPGGTALVLRSVMAGHPPRFIYDCPVCKHPYYLDKKAERIEWTVRSGEVVCGS